MKKLLSCTLFCLGMFTLSSAQTTLSPGDVAIVGVRSDAPNEFTLVLLNNVLAGTEILFTNNGWMSSSTALRSGEDVMTWRANLNLPLGTRIVFHNDGTGTQSNIGQVINGKMDGLSTDGDQILVFQGSVSSPSFLFAINFDGNAWDTDATSNNNSALPPGLTNGSNAVSIPEADNMLYLSDSINLKAFLLSKICNPANWTTNDDPANMDPSDNGRLEFGVYTGTPGIRTTIATFFGNFGITPVNVPSAAESFGVLGSSLSGDITLSVNAPFELSTGGAYSTSVTLSPSSGNASGTVQVRLNSSIAGNFTDTIQITSPGAFKNQLLVTGTAASNPVVQFMTTSAFWFESNSMDSIGVRISNKGLMPVTIDLIPAPGATALAGVHFNFPMGSQLVFDAVSRDTQYVQVTLVDDASSGPRIRRADFGLMAIGGDVGSNDSFSISIQENDYKHSLIAEIKQLDALGQAISSDSLFQVSGVVYGNNTLSAGYSFTLIDATAGISCLGLPPWPDFGYSPSEGDSVLMRGRLTQNNGLIYLDMLDTIRLIQSGATLKDPVVVNAPDESGENDLIRINQVAFVNAPFTWATSGSGTGYQVYNTLTHDTFEVFILPGSGLANTSAPGGVFDIIGIGWQDDESQPYDSNYQLRPRHIYDVQIDALADFDLVSPVSNSTIVLEGDTGTSLLFTWNRSDSLNGYPSPSYTFLLDVLSGDFTLTVLSIPVGPDTSLTLSYQSIINSLGSALPHGGELDMKWTVVASNDFESVWAQSVYFITFERGVMDGLEDLSQWSLVYPNPVQTVLFVEMPEPAESLTLSDVTGRVLMQSFPSGSLEQIDLSALPEGVYLLRIHTGERQYVHRVIKR